MVKNRTILFFVFAIALSGCQETVSTPKVQTSVQIVEWHTHSLTVRYRDVNNGREVYTLEESAGHRHEIFLTPENRAFLLLRMPVSVTSTEAAGHSHSVSLRIADD